MKTFNSGRLGILCGFAVFASAAKSAAYEHFLSPDRRMEAYTTAGQPDGTGMKLFLRGNRPPTEGMLLWQNERWIDAKWSRDSRFLALTDHPDGHVADVYVFGITSRGKSAPPSAALLLQTPAPFTYDVQWEVVRWRLRSRQIVLSQEVRDQNARTFTRHLVTARIGSKPLPYEKTGH